VGATALAAENLATDCVRHARLFFNRPDFDLASAQRGSWGIEPSAGMPERLRGDYEKTMPMIFGAAPTFEEIMASMKKINDSVNKDADCHVPPDEYACAAEILKGTVGSVLNLRGYFQKYFDGFMESAGSLPAEHRAKIKESVQYRGFSDSFVVCVALRNDDEQLTPAIGLYACLLAACGAMTSSLAAKRPLRGVDAGLGMLIADREVYGPALERAYALEAGEAEYCRTVIGDELWGYLTLLEGQSFSHPHGQMAKEIGRRAKELIVTDSDGRKALDYLGQHFFDMSGEIVKSLIQPAYDFVVEQHRFWQAEKNEKLAERYNKARIYFEQHKELWVLRESKS
jgi:hypothetical protein